jgi:hypothetical protein
MPESHNFGIAGNLGSEFYACPYKPFFQEMTFFRAGATSTLELDLATHQLPCPGCSVQEHVSEAEIPIHLCALLVVSTS